MCPHFVEKNIEFKQFLILILIFQNTEVGHEKILVIV